MADEGEVMGYTHKGRKWEYQQSWYLLALFSPWTFWFPLVYTGLRTLQYRWIIWGMFYGLPAFITMKFDPADFGVESFFKRWIFAALVVAAIHTFRARGEFLVRLATAIETREFLMEGARLRRERAMTEMNGDGDPTEGESAAPEPAQAALTRIRAQVQEALEAAPRADPRPTPERNVAAAATPPARRLFDVNLIGERELAMLPGMGPERARQAVALRQTLGSYHSFDHFAEKMGLSDDARERLRPIFIQPPPAHETSDEYTTLADGRRILEINLASAQAIATLPGLNQDLGRRAVALRESDGWFRSTEDFRYRLGLSTQLMVGISPFVSTVRTAATQAGGRDAGRVVDAGSSSATGPAAAAKPSGRIVDL